MKLCLLNGIDDINDDNTATLWWFKDEPELNEPLHCQDVTQMFNAAELMQLIRDEVDVDENRVWMFCNTCCSLCAIGHPIDDNGYHYPTQKKGMIPYAKCTNKINQKHKT